MYLKFESFHFWNLLKLFLAESDLFLCTVQHASIIQHQSPSIRSHQDLCKSTFKNSPFPLVHHIRYLDPTCQINPSSLVATEALRPFHACSYKGHLVWSATSPSAISMHSANITPAQSLSRSSATLALRFSPMTATSGLLVSSALSSLSPPASKITSIRLHPYIWPRIRPHDQSCLKLILLKSLLEQHPRPFLFNCEVP